MRIAFLYDCVYPFKIGGVERRVWELARRLALRGHDVHQFGMKFWDGPDTIGREGVVIHGISPLPGYAGRNDVQGFPEYCQQRSGSVPELYIGGRRAIVPALRYSAALLRPLLSEGFDILDVQHFPYFPVFSAAFASRLRNAPMVVTWHEVWDRYWGEYLGGAGFVGRGIERMAARLPGQLVAVSGTTRDQLRQIHVTKPVTVVPNGIDTAFLASVAPVSERWDLIFAGRLISEKRVSLLLDAVSFLRKDSPALSVLIVGDGPERMQLMQQAERLGISGNVTFRDFTRDPAGFYGILKSGRVFVSPSMREGFGMTALEAMGCGIPVVTVNHPRNAVRELVTPATGCIAEPDPGSLAAAIRTCLAGSSGYRDACLRAANRFDWDRIVPELEQVYETAVAAKSSGRTS